MKIAAARTYGGIVTLTSRWVLVSLAAISIALMVFASAHAEHHDHDDHDADESECALCAFASIEAAAAAPDVELTFSQVLFSIQISTPINGLVSKRTALFILSRGPPSNA